MSIVVVPELLFADEPTTGFDPRSRNQVWALRPVLSGRGKSGCTLPGLDLWPESAGGALIFAFSVSWIWTALGLVARTPNSVLWVSTLIMFPLTFASNILVEPKTMPGWLQSFVAFNPVTHLVGAVRGLMSGTIPAGQIAWLLVGCVVLVVIFAPITMYLYRSKK